MTTKTGIIYLQRDKFHVYSPYLSSIVEFRFVPELIRDFDLVNKELLENLLKVFLANNKIPPSNIVIIVADSASFIKDFVSPPPPSPSMNPQQPQTPPPTLEDLHNQANEYLEHIPFESVGSKVFPLATGVRAYATNQEIYDALKTILEKQGFIISSVLPGFVLGPNLSNRPVLDGSSVGAILERLSTLQAYNLLKESSTSVVAPESTLKEEAEEKENSVPEEETTGLEKPENKKIVLAVAISAIVLIVVITGFIVYAQFQERPYTPPPRTPAASAPSPTPQAAQPAETQEVKDLAVQITAPASQASASAALRTALIPLGFKSIVPQVQTGLGSAQDLLIFSSNVTPATRTAVTDVVKGIVPDVIVQERADAAADIVVILGE